MTKVGFVGLGNMGGPMAKNLLQQGFELKGYDIVPQLLDEAVKLGAVACDSAKDAATEVDVFISMLPASKHVQKLYLGDEGVLSCLQPETLVMDCSTIAPTVSQEVSSAAKKSALP